MSPRSNVVDDEIYAAAVDRALRTLLITVTERWPRLTFLNGETTGARFFTITFHGATASAVHAPARTEFLVQRLGMLRTSLDDVEALLMEIRTTAAGQALLRLRERVLRPLAQVPAKKPRAKWRPEQLRPLELIDDEVNRVFHHYVCERAFAPI